jgi:hypothetical protein
LVKNFRNKLAPAAALAVNEDRRVYVGSLLNDLLKRLNLRT